MERAALPAEGRHVPTRKFLVMMMMIMKETQKRLQKMPVLFWVMKLAAFVRRVWNNQHIVDGHGELASTRTKKLRPSD